MKNNFHGEYTDDWPEISERVKELAGWKCVRCGHPNDKESGHVLTVHHLDGDKTNNEWWNIPALCQCCHLRIQGRVIMARFWMFEHSEWFKPYAAGYYAKIFGCPTDREWVMRNMDLLLALGRRTGDHEGGQS
jgi:5-methylcytosine-specific restriction endonuclease McrA